jgi:glycosyltransferase involved in cell wall biosynthesis
MTTRSPLRVGVLIDSLRWGGAETLLTEFTIAAQAHGIEVSIAYLHRDAEAAPRLREVGVDPVHVPISGLLRPSDLRRVRAHPADVVHTHLGSADVVGGLAARKLAIPAVSTLHVMEWEWIRRGRARARLRLMSAVRRRCAARVITVSEAARRSYLDQRLDTPERVVTVHNGIVDRAEPGAGEVVRAELGIPAEAPVIATLSVLRHGKNHDLSAAAATLLSDRFPDLRLLILGEGPERARIEHETRHLGDRVVFTGHRDDVLRVLDAVDVVVHPTSVDAFPTALLEAMAARVPAVATAVGGIPEAIEDGVTGVLIDPPPTSESLAAAVAPLLEDPAARLRLGARGRERFEERFTADRWIARLFEVYRRVTRGEPAQAQRPTDKRVESVA